MRRRSFEQLLEKLGELSREQLRQLSGMAHGVAGAGDAAEVIETARRPYLICPSCTGTQLYRHGHANGMQRFRCRACGRTFNSLTGTPMARLRRKDKWLAYCQTLLDPATTVRRSADQVAVHRNTTFRWRHRMLTLTKRDRHTPLQGVVEADVMYTPESRKGSRSLDRPPRTRGIRASKRVQLSDQVCVLAARDRNGRTVDAILGRGPVTVKHLRAHLMPALEKDVLLVTNAHPAYRKFARKHGLSHCCVSASTSRSEPGVLHLRHVSGYLTRLQDWLIHFHGVATRYLSNYCGWHWAMDRQRINSPAALLRRTVGVFNS